MVRQVPVGKTLPVEIVCVLCHPVDECPSEITASYLFSMVLVMISVLKFAQAMVQMALYGQRLVQELLQHIFLGRLAENDTLGMLVLEQVS